MIDAILPFSLTLFRWINLAVWASVAVRLTPSVIRSVTRHVQGLEPIWCLFWGVAVNRLWLWFHGTAYGEQTHPNSALDLLIAWYAFAIALGVGVHMLRTWYGLGVKAKA